MKMRILSLAIACFFVVLALRMFSQAQSKARHSKATSSTERLVQEYNSVGMVLQCLASERYSALTKNNALIIMAVSETGQLKKFFDGEIEVIFLPGGNDPMLYNGLCFYAEHFNIFTQYTADEILRRREYSKAKKIYRVLLHFMPRRSQIGEGGILERIRFLDRMEKGGSDGDKALAEFNKRYGHPVVGIDFARLAPESRIEVTNLFQLPK